MRVKVGAVFNGAAQGTALRGHPAWNHNVTAPLPAAPGSASSYELFYKLLHFCQNVPSEFSEMDESPFIVHVTHPDTRLLQFDNRFNGDGFSKDGLHPLRVRPYDQYVLSSGHQLTIMLRYF